MEFSLNYPTRLQFNKNFSCLIAAFVLTFSFPSFLYAAGACSPYIGQATLNEFFKDQSNQTIDSDDFAEVKILNDAITSTIYQTWTINICEKDGAGNNSTDTDGCSGNITLNDFTDKSKPWLVYKNGAIGSDIDIGKYINLKSGFDATLLDANGDLIDYLTIDGYSKAITGISCNLSNLVFDYQATIPGNQDKTIFRSPDGTGDWEGAPAATAPPTEDAGNSNLPTPPSGETYPIVTINNINVDIGGNAVFTVSLVDASGSSKTFSQTVTVSYYTQDGTATVADGDYTAVPLTGTPSTVSIAAGQSSTTITIASPSSNYADIGQIFYAVLNAVENSATNGGNPNATISKHFGEAKLDGSGCSFTTTGIIGQAEIDIQSGVSYNNGTSTTTLTSGQTTNNSVLLDGTLANQTLTLPTLPAITFVTTPDATLSDGDTLAAGSYDVVTIANGATITLSAGTYNIDQFLIGNNVTINVTGAVIINTNEFLFSGAGDSGNIKVNDGGVPANFIINLYNSHNAEFDLGDDSSFTGIINSSFSNTKIEIDDDNTFTGGIFTNGEVQLKDNSTITYNDAARAAAFSVIGCLPIRTPPTVTSQVNASSTPTIKGTYDSSDAAGGFTVTVAGTTYTLGASSQLTASGDNWTLVITTPITAGIYNVVASSTNGFSNIISDTTTNELTVGAGSCFSDSYPIFAGKDLDIKDNNISFTYSGTTTTLTEAKTADGAINTSGVTSTQTPTLPTLPAITFVTTPDASLSNGGTLAPGNYDVVTIANNATITLSAGTFNVDQFLIGKGVTINVSGAVIINTNEFVYSGGGAGNITVNSGGVPANFIVNIYSGHNAEFDIEDNSSFTGIIFSSFSNTTIEIDDDNTFTGAIFSNGDVDLKDGSSINFTAAAKTAAASVLKCSVNSIDHFAINYSSATGTGINCQAEKITIVAHNSSHTDVTDYTGLINLSASTPTHGDWSKTTTASDANGTLTAGTADTGSATYKFVTGDNGSIILNYKNTHSETVSLNAVQGSFSETSGSAVAKDDYSIIFSAAGFNFLANDVKDTIGLQIGGKRSDIAPGSQTLKLAAVKTNTTTGACESAFTGNTAVEIAVECVNPSSCSTADKFFISTDDGSTFDQIDNTPELTYTSLTDFNFGAATVTTAPIIIRYDDVGKIKLHARKTITPSNEVMSGSSNEFVVRPFAFYPYITANPAAINSGGTAFTTAGTNFTVNVKAVLWQSTDDDGSGSIGTANDGIADGHESTDTNPANNVVLSDNAVANNYGQETPVEQVLLQSLLNQPSPSTAGVVDPGLDDSSANGSRITSFSAATGIGSSTTINFDEVGIIEIFTKVSDGDYLAIGTTETAKIVGRSGFVGRFYPHHFETDITHACSNTFTYSGQPFIATVFARNLGNTTTKNYRDAFAYTGVILSDKSPAAPPTGTFANNTIGAISFSSDSATNGASYGIGSTEVANNFTYTFNDKKTIPDLLEIRATDIKDSSSSNGYTEDSTQIRSGRAKLENVFGSELTPLTVPLTIQYFSDNATPANLTDDSFITSTSDSCSTYDAPNGTLANYTDNLTSGEVAVTGTATVSLGIGNIIFHKPLDTTAGPGVGNEGSVNLLLDNLSSWLTYSWGIDCDNADGDNDTSTGVDNGACSTASFGLYRGDDRIIYWREVF